MVQTFRGVDVTSRTVLGRSGRRLSRDVAAAHDLDPVQLVLLHEACRAKDRLDRLDALIRTASSVWGEVGTAHGSVVLTVDAPLAKANTTANVMKQLIAAMRLPDESGRRPPRRGGARGAYRPRST